MPSGVYQLPNLLSLFPKKTRNNISPHFQEAKHGYEQWVRENFGYFAAIVSSVIMHARKCILMDLRRE